MTKLNIKKIIQSKIFFLVSLALIMVIMRLIIFDYRIFFQAQYIPNHDMYQGAAFFSTNAHSMRLNGEIVWWNSIAQNGYAQYYQSFLSPLAPTTGNIVFIGWMQAIRVLDFLSIAFPEYLQYLTINYAVFPFLAFLSFGWFVSCLFRSRYVVSLMMIIYVFSGIGLWNSAWFYFQEAFTLFFLLGAFLALLKRPNLGNWLIALVAILIQVTSTNYWTIYNSWFILIIIIAYAITHKAQFHSWLLKTRCLIKTNNFGTSVILGLFTLVLLLWGTLLTSIFTEQAGNYTRATINASAYSTTQALSRVQDLRWHTLELFNPEIERAVENYNYISNYIHMARYIGAFLIPLLALIPFYRWRSQEKFLIVSTGAVLAVCLAPILLVGIWQALPFFDRNYHFFYFYTHHFQLMVVLLAGSSLDHLLGSAHNIDDRKTFTNIVTALIAVTGLAFFVYQLVSASFTSELSDRISLEANLHFLMWIALVSIGLRYALQSNSKLRYTYFATFMIFVALIDLSAYFYEVTVGDHIFTRSRWQKQPYPLSLKIQDKLHSPWQAPSLSGGFNGGIFQNMPIINDFWPKNHYLKHINITSVMQSTSDNILSTLIDGGPPLEFYRQDQCYPENVITEKDVLNDPYSMVIGDTKCIRDSQVVNYNYKMIKWYYNQFAFDVSVPKDGYLLIRQLYDPLWKIELDNKPVVAQEGSMVITVIPIEEGEHTLTMEYFPLGRRLYWPASLLLEVTILVFFILARNDRLRQNS